MIQFFFIIGVIVFFMLIFYLIRKGALSIKYSIFWLFFAACMLLFSIFPNLLRTFSRFLGFVVPANGLFSLLFLFCMVMLMLLTSLTYQQAQKIKKLAQSQALLEKRVRNLEEDLEKKNR